MRQLFFFLLCFLLPHFIQAQDCIWTQASDKVNITNKLQFLEDKNGQYSISDILQPEIKQEFRQSEQQILNFGFTESVYWLKFSFSNTTSENLFLEVAHASLPICDLYYQTDSGQIIQTKAGYNVPLYDKEIVHHFQIFNLPVGQHEFFLRVISNSHPLPVTIMTQAAFQIENNEQKLVYGFYIGFMLFVIIMNLFFFVSHRNRLYLYYSLVAFIYACYAAMVLDGFVLYLLPDLDMMFWYITIPTIGMAAQTAYCLAFLEAKKYSPRLYKVVKGIVIYFAIYIFLKYLLTLPVILAVNTAHALLSFFIMGYVGFRVGKKGNRLGYYFALAYFIYFLLVLTEAIYIQTGSPKYVLGLSHVAWATLIEAFVLSYLLSKRSEWERQETENEKQQAQLELMKSLRENERIVKEQNLLLEKKVAERTKSIKQVNQKLKIAMATKDKFFSIIAHDLKSPFNSLIGLTDVMLHEFESSSPEEKKKFLEVINSSLNDTHNLLSNLLMWAQTQKEELSLNIKEVDISQLIDDIQRLLKHHADKKEIALINHTEQNLLINADFNMLQTIILNLVNNAIKFTSPKGKVEVGTLNKANKHLTIFVKDNGMGIDDETQKSLFDLSQHYSSPGTAHERGTGLGLIICKEFVEKHGGKIWLESELNKGTTIYFSIPSNTNIN